MDTTSRRQNVAWRHGSLVAGSVVVLIGLLVILGWALDVRTLRSVVPNLVEMKANTAACFVLAGSALILLGARQSRATTNCLSGIVFAVGLVTFGEYVTGWDAGLDEILFKDPLSLTLHLPPGRMAMAAALTFTLVAASLVLVRYRRDWVITQVLALGAIVIPAVSLVGYLFGEHGITMTNPYTSLAINTAAAFTLMGIGILCECAEAGPMSVFFSDGPGGALLRRLLPISLAWTLLLGFSTYLGARGNFYSYGSGMVVFVVINSVVLTAAIWSNAWHLNLAEDRRYQDRDLLELTLKSIGDAVISTDAQARVSFMNRVAESLTGWTQAEAIGVPLVEVFNVVNETTRKPVVNPSIRALREGKIVALANHSLLIAKDGSERPVEDSAAPIQHHGKPIAGTVLVFRDVTERRRHEEKHQEVLTRLESTLSAGEIGTWEYDPIKLLFRADPNFSKMLGISDEEAAAKPNETFLNAIHAEDRARVVRLFEMALISNELFESEHRLIGTDGQVRWVVSRGRVEKNPNTGNLSMPGMVVDITERKLAEERLHHLAAKASEANAKFRAFFEQGVSFAGIMELDGTLIETNPLAWQGCGFDKDAIIGKPFWEGPWWSPSPFLVETIKHASERAVLGEVFQSELPYYLADGSIRQVDFLLVPIKDDAGKVLFLAPTGSDITDRKRAEADRQKFVTLAENSVDFIAMYDHVEGRPTYINRAGLNLVGLDGLEAASQTDVRDFFFDEDQSLMMDDFLPKVLERGHGEIEIRFRNFKTGEARWMACKVLTLPDEANMPSLLATVSQDITSRRQLEDNLRMFADDLSRADRRKDEFLATLAHELRNPLAPVRNALQIMRMEADDRRVVEESRILMERQVSHMVRLIDDLMDVSRINRAKLELRKEQVALATIVQTAVETSRPLILASGHELTVSLPTATVTVEADVTRLAQVIANLLNNAAKYTEYGGKIVLTVDRQGADIVIAVRDNGVGIPASMLPRIFDLFTQVDQSLERSQGGLGIGLALVKTLVEMHGGRIEVRSGGEGLGSEFVVRLPIVVDVQESLPATTGDRSRSPVQCKTKRRILVVDDNHDSARTLSKLLRLMGYETRTANDGEEAVREADSYRPEIILLDIGLPLMNGYDVASTIRSRDWGQDVAIIALTGWGQENDRCRSKDAGIDHHLVKPVDPEILETMLADVEVGQFSRSV